ncbi:MAG: Xaa-Pro dipeptidase [Pseudomonadales bacterium]
MSNSNLESSAQGARTTFSDHLRILGARWAQALQETGFDAVRLDAGELDYYFLDDQSPPWRPNPHFAQWVPGVDCAGSSLVVGADGAATLFFLSPQDYWHQPPTLPERVATALPVRVFKSAEDLTRALRQATDNARIAQITRHTPENGAALNPAELIARIDWDRARKTAWELECMSAATDRAVRGHAAAARAWAQGKSEFDIALGYLDATGHTATELPYHSIIACNAHAALLHYQHYDRTPTLPRRSLLIDAGAAVHGYAADITRTHVASDTPDAAQFAALRDALDVEQQALLRQIRPGMSYLDLHVSAHSAIARILTDHEVLLCSAATAFTRGLTRAFLPHGLGHLLGLQVHDVGGLQTNRSGASAQPPAEYPSLRLTRTVEVDQVFTIEPGIYFIPMLLERLRAGPDAALLNSPLIERLMPFGGIRIEDNVVVTANGVRNLTREAFARIEATPQTSARYHG